ncbi:MAG: nickel pincer cofactor biosynthesis protein LarC [Methanotrichaceae archaeon]
MLALLFDPYSGASGDMIMGCLLDLGADKSIVHEAVRSVGCKLEISRESRCHISAVRAKVLSDRRYHSVAEAKSILQGSSLEDDALQMAMNALEVLANAESRVHGIPKEEAKFHEIGAMDALADIAGSCAALQSLKAERRLSMPVSVGGGNVSSQHGLLPVPGPAALEILRDFNILWKGGPIDQELLTPTGAALMAVMIDRFILEYPLIRAEKVGYGAGSRDYSMPNALRAVIGEIRHENLAPDRVVQLETNVDDVTGEVLGHLIEMLMDAGALDVSLIPAIMKKGRSGSVIRAIVLNDDIERLSRLIMLETGSLGLRVFPSIHRYVAAREEISVAIAINGVSYRSSAKVSRLGRDILNIKPEYEDCRKIAATTGLPLRTIIKKVEEEGWRSNGC